MAGDWTDVDYLELQEIVHSLPGPIFDGRFSLTMKVPTNAQKDGGSGKMSRKDIIIDTDAWMGRW